MKERGYNKATRPAPRKLRFSLTSHSPLGYDSKPKNVKIYTIKCGPHLYECILCQSSCPSRGCHSKLDTATGRPIKSGPKTQLLNARRKTHITHKHKLDQGPTTKCHKGRWRGYDGGAIIERGLVFEPR